MGGFNGRFLNDYFLTRNDFDLSECYFEFRHFVFKNLVTVSFGSLPS